VHHRTVSGAPGSSTLNLSPSRIWGGRSAIIHRTIRCSTGLSGVAPDYPVCQAEQRSSAPTVVRNATVNSEQCNCARRSQSRRQKAHRTVNRTCPVAPLSEAPTVGTQRPGDVAGALDSVRWRTGLSGAPYDRSLHQRSLWWLGL
jgi:hypothetical protein